MASHNAIEKDNDKDDDLALSSSTLAALQSFYADRDAHAQQFARLQAAAEAEEQQRHDGDSSQPRPKQEQQQQQQQQQQQLSMSAFTEDWNKSQFWYSDATATTLARLLLDGASADTAIAVVSAPSVFVQLKNIVNSSHADAPRPRLVLLEHDSRFGVFPEFVFYDYLQPVKLPGHLKGSFDRLICDPPFLSEECQTKAAITVNWLLKPLPSFSPSPSPPSSSFSSPHPTRPSFVPPGTCIPTADTPTTPRSTPPPPPPPPPPSATDNPTAHLPTPAASRPDGPRLIVCTGERMRDLVTRLYRPRGVRATDFEIAHARGLSNEFYCYANFECGEWGWRGG